MRRQLAVLGVGMAMIAATGSAHGASHSNPCAGPGSRHLLCPNLRIGRPSDLYATHTARGRVLLRATSDVKSRGRGPIELRGRRNGRRSMRVNQRIYRPGGGHVTVRTRATLHFTDVGDEYGGYFWKVHRLATFELWSVGRRHLLLHRVRVGPKTNYCLRDLERTRPGRRSPRGPHYPGCNQSPRTRRVALGTSVGWSDVYPADYDRQWINVTGLRGCFAFVMKVDPRNLFYESNERDNAARRLVHLPYRGRPAC